MGEFDKYLLCRCSVPFSEHKLQKILTEWAFNGYLQSSCHVPGIVLSIADSQQSQILSLCLKEHAQDDMYNREAAARWSTKGQIQDSRALVNSVSITIFICFSKRSFPTMSNLLSTQEAGLLLLLDVIAATFLWLCAMLREHPQGTKEGKTVRS